jgi:16S rRNA (cytidine1402-2'-O)-methyltransferase
MPGTLFVVATPIGNLEDITLRALRVLREVAVIAAEDTRRTAHLLARHAIATPTTSLHEHNETQKSASIVARLLRGDDVALVSDAGSPTIADPGRKLVAEAVAAGIRVEPIPGANAVVTALMASGLPADSFSFLGFPPARGKDRKVWLQRLAGLRGIAVFYEAPHRVLSTLTEILSAVGDCEAVIGRELTKKHEELVRGPISVVANRLGEPKGELTVVLDLGHKPVYTVGYIGETTENVARSRRGAIAALAKSLGLAPNEVYAALAQLMNR